MNVATLNSITTWHIHIQGQVQGVGFRPFVYKLAKENQLTGWVNNAVDGVHVEVNASKKAALEFYRDLMQNAPRLSIITEHCFFQTEQKFFENFQIVSSESQGQANLLLTPDFAICANCREELYDSRRSNYPFITCTNCGPRYSIIRQLPYDRERSTMAGFKMCPLCAREYQNPSDRRYYSQTNSCPDCSIHLTLWQVLQNGKVGKISSEPETVLEQTVKAWQKGKITAIKGIGGYLLCCDASNPNAIQLLRQRKHRPTKPFAVMYPDLESLAGDVQLKEMERLELRSSVSPIVLLEWRKETQSSVCKNAIAPGLKRLGAMLPYAPLFDLLLQEFGKPIVATSGNVSNSPIVFEDENALNELNRVADLILTNDREIVVPQDDSVVQFSLQSSQRIIIRRSRGIAPTYINAALDMPKQTILAAGAMLKSSFTFLHNQNVFISQYLGDLEHFDTQENYRHTAEHFFQLFGAMPEVILADKHPHYFSSQFGEMLATELGIPLHKIQHHIAHFGAVLGENNLVASKEAVLGVIWDGTGLGDDGQIWGGEFFKYEQYEFQHCCHFEYFDFILGDKMPKEPRISALTATWGIEGATALLKDKFSEMEWRIYNQLLQKGSPLKTSSVGRLFDAVASLLGLKDKVSFEGEAAMLLENLAQQFFQKQSLDFSDSYYQEADFRGLSTKFLMERIIRDLNGGLPKDLIAARFHLSLVHLIKIIANDLNIKKIAFSGGVFQNSLLIDLIALHLGSEFDLYFHQQLSPNDENVSFGQLICYTIKHTFF